MRLIDISPVVSAALEGWPGDTRYACEPRWTQSGGDSCTVSRIVMSTHLGAHADAPLHYAQGAADAAGLALEPYVGPARLIQAPGIDRIGTEAALWVAGAERALYRVLAEGADPHVFPKTFAPLTPEGARALVRLGIRLFGTDAPSVDPVDSRTLEAHHVLHEGGVAILEGLMLADVPAGDYELLALPLKWRGADAAPVRAVLRTRDQETREWTPPKP